MATIPIKAYINSAYSFLAVATVEESRLLFHLVEQFPNRTTKTIDASGVTTTWNLTTDKQRLVASNPTKPPQQGNPFIAAFEATAKAEQQTLVAFDAHHFIRNPQFYRGLKNVAEPLKQKQSIIILVAPTWQLPPELEHEIDVLDWDLPTRSELVNVLNGMHANMERLTKKPINIDEDERTKLLDNMTGLTINQGQDVLSLSWTDRKSFDPDVVMNRKIGIIKNSGYLEYWPSISPDSIGGLSVLKGYITDEVLPAKDDMDLRVKGILLVGIPGTGKSLAAKATSGILGWPLLRLDISSLKGSLVGQSEANIKAALRLVDAMSPCVVWADEIEKAVGGYASSAYTDSGVTLGMVGTLLTWLQEHTSPAIVVATCNDRGKLPPELTRAGRFDTTFFVDLPSTVERMEIAAIHLARYTGSIDLAPYIAQRTKEFTGAEIQQVVISVARRTNRKPTEAMIDLCVEGIKPLAVTDPQRVEAMREFAQKSLRIANTPEEVAPVYYDRLVAVE